MKPFWKTVLLLTLLAGTLDIIAACTHVTLKTGHFPNRIFQVIAGGLIGIETAMKHLWPAGILGCFLHYFITFSFILFYFLVYPKMPILQKNKVLSAFALGLFIWVVMNLIVLPMSALPNKPIVWPDAIIGMIVLPLVIGLPAAIGAEKYYGKINRRPAL
jgi:hypothetical protein